MAKLDRFLVWNEVVEKFANMVGLVLPRAWSDHSPIVLKNEYLDYGSTLFKVFHLDGFDDIVTVVWGELETIEGDNKFIAFKDKLKNVKEKLKI